MGKRKTTDFEPGDSWGEAEQLARALVHLAAQYALHAVEREQAARRVQEGLSAIGSGDLRRMRRARMQAEGAAAYD